MFGSVCDSISKLKLKEACGGKKKFAVSHERCAQLVSTSKICRVVCTEGVSIISVHVCVCEREFTDTAVWV